VRASYSRELSANAMTTRNETNFGAKSCRRCPLILLCLACAAIDTARPQCDPAAAPGEQLSLWCSGAVRSAEPLRVNRAPSTLSQERGVAQTLRGRCREEHGAEGD